mmetsp:Transcript_17724/g.30884  ORF Transcript_17724/g.30884 Transcript_17724/m.30884 type:complete len:212 (-) Transcript_17724:206-841(-)
MLLENVTTLRGRLEDLEFGLRRLAIVQLVVAAGFEVNRHNGVGLLGDVRLEDLQGYIIVIQLVVAEGDVDVQGQVIPVFYKHSLVDVRGFLEVTPQVLNRRQAQLVLLAIAQSLMVYHHGTLVVALVRRLEQHSRFQRAVWSLLGFLLSLRVLAKCIVTAGLIDVDVGVVLPPHRVIVGVDGLLVISIVEVTVREPHQQPRSIFSGLPLEL